MKKLDLDFILFDLIGTTITDTNNGSSLIIDCFQEAFAQNGYNISHEVLNQQRGKRKREAIEHILVTANLEKALANQIYTTFIALLNQNVAAFSEIEGVSELFQFLQERNLKIGIGSGLPMVFMKRLLLHLDWDANNFAYIGSSDDLVAGRPDPIMIFEAMQKLELTDASRILKIGDTRVDVEEGKNAKAITAMVLTGTQDATALGAIQPDYIWSSVKEVRKFV